MVCLKTVSQNQQTQPKTFWHLSRSYSTVAAFTTQDGDSDDDNNNDDGDDNKDVL